MHFHVQLTYGPQAVECLNKRVYECEVLYLGDTEGPSSLCFFVVGKGYTARAFKLIVTQVEN